MAADKSRGGGRFGSTTFILSRRSAPPAAKCLDSPSANFADSNPYLYSSSPDPTPSPPAEIVMISPPDSLDSSEQNVVFRTPPEDQCRRLSSSSEDGNPPDELRGKSATIADSGVGCNRLEKARVSDGAREDDPELKKTGVQGGEFDEEIEVGTDTGVIAVDGGDCVEEMSAVNLADDSSGKIIDCVQNPNAIDETHVTKRKRRTTGNRRRRIGKMHCGSSHLGDSPVISEVRGENMKLRCDVGSNGTDETRPGCGVGGVGKVVSIDGKGVEERNGLGIGGGESIGGTSGVIASMPEMAKENEKNDGWKSEVGNVRKKCALIEYLDVIKVLVRNLDGSKEEEDDDEDILEIVKKRGITFPKQRW